MISRPLIILALVAVSGLAHAQAILLPQKNARCSLVDKQVTPVVKIGPNGLYDARVPSKKPYALMTVAERSWVRSFYLDLAEDDEPPYPVDGLEAFFQELSRKYESMERSPRGYFAISFIVPKRGGAGSISPGGHVTPLSRWMVLWASTHLTFTGGYCDGHDQTMEFPIVVQFD